MKRIGLYPNAKRDSGLQGTREVIRTLRDCGVSFYAPLAFSEALAEEKKVHFVSEEALFRESECLVTLGGDGTILSVARRAAEQDLPIFGINLGHVGFMAALEKNQIGRVRALADGDFFESSRMLLDCAVNGKRTLSALNELVIAPERGFHIVELSLLAGEKKLCDFRADGLIFNTPTGSTGYAFSAGGAVMDAEYDAIGVKAISSYLLVNAHHMIFRPETVFTALGCRSEDSAVTVCADGRETSVIGEGDVVTISRSPHRVRLYTLEPRSNQEVFFRKF
ncbi:MAG: NAD(+)/NADH kinase [Clostridia bacterium]|nr:NAD(+)/NADH kinase [Clostridia bacterium]